MLCNEARVPAHGSLASVVERFRRSKTRQNEFTALMLGFFPAVFRNHPQFRCAELKTGTESGTGETLFQGIPSWRFRHDILPSRTEGIPESDSGKSCPGAEAEHQFRNEGIPGSSRSRSGEPSGLTRRQERKIIRFFLAPARPLDWKRRPISGRSPRIG